MDNKNPLKSLKQIDSAHLQSSQLVTSPLVRTLLALLHIGTLSARYFDRDFIKSKTGTSSPNTLKEHSFKDIYAEKKQ